MLNGIIACGFDDNSLQDILDIISSTNVNEVDCKGRTSIMLACYLDDLFVVQVLVNLGADATILDNDGKTALDYCKKSNAMELASI